MNIFKNILQILLFSITITHSKRLTDAQKKSLEESKKCREAANAQVHPLDCCKYPRFYDNTPQNLRECDTNCRMLPYPLFSCVRNCIIERYGVFTKTNNGAIGLNRITDAFVDQDEIPGIRPLSPVWRSVVQNSSMFCYSEFPLSPSNDGRRNVSSEESWNYYYMNYVECIRKRNFLECIVNDIPGCRKLREAIFHCYQPDYGFLHQLFFEDFYYRNKTEEARLKNLKAENKPDLYEESHKDDVTQSSATSDSPDTNSDVDIKSTLSGADTTSFSNKSRGAQSGTQEQFQESGTNWKKTTTTPSQDPGVNAMK
ncbi:uncharacterized protein [Chironomus tepperi]|uniref:uncharacterized protein n=1 Tax=Chironomus tepperi TaxID=113505 RepID=UPI00391F7410